MNEAPNYFSRVELNLEMLARSGNAHLLAGDGYRVHQALWKLFARAGNEARDFLYHRIADRGVPSYYVVSARPPGQIPYWRVQTKAYAPAFQAGDRLAFSLRANPVVTRRNPDTGKSVRHDVVMDARKLDAKAPEAGRVASAGVQWLTSRAERHGFQAESVQADGYTQHRLRKRSADHSISFSTLDYCGILSVTDPQTLARTLMAGLGSAKGFGCGLLLLRRI